MRSRKVITTLSLTAVMLAMITMPAMAYVIDGDLDDWGVNPTNNDWIADLPAQSVYENWYWGPTSTGSNHNPGVEQCDIEAMYVDQDDCYIYFAIITSMPPDGFVYMDDHLYPGDLGLDFDGDNYFEFGIKLAPDGVPGTATGPIGTIYKNPAWILLSPTYAQGITGSTNMESGTYAGYTGDIIYTSYNDWSSDHNRANYVIEMKVDKSVFGIDVGESLDIQATVSCANDKLEILQFPYTPIPEFTTIAMPVGIIMGLFYFYRRKRQIK